MPGYGKSRYVAGDHNVRCDICGFVYKRSDCMMQWNNLLACDECYDPKHPQLNVRGYVDRQTVRDARPESDNDNDLRFYTPPSPDLRYNGFVVDNTGTIIASGLIFDSGVIYNGN